MPDQNKPKNEFGNGSGVVDTPNPIPETPVHAPYYRVTVGLKRQAPIHPEGEERKRLLEKQREGNWDLEELRRQQALQTGQQAKETSSKSSKKPKKPPNLLVLGQKLCRIAIGLKKNGELPTDLNWLELKIVLGDFSSASDELLAAAFCNLEPKEKLILSKDYALGLEIDKGKRLYYSGDKLSEIVTTMQLYLKAIVVYIRHAKAAKAGKTKKQEPEKPRFTLAGKPIKARGCVKKTGDGDTADAASVSLVLFFMKLVITSRSKRPKSYNPGSPPFSAEPGTELWLETLPLFSGKQVRFQDFSATGHDSHNDTLSESIVVEKSSRFLFLGLDWKATGLPLFENLGEILVMPPESQVVLGPQKSNWLELSPKGELVIDKELAEAVQLKWDGKNPGKNGIRPEIAKIISRLRISDIKILMMLGIKKRKMSTVANHLNTTPAVLISDVEELIQKINNP